MGKNQVTIFSKEDMGSYMYCNKLMELNFKKTVRRYLERSGSDYSKVAELSGTTEDAVRKIAEGADTLEKPRAVKIAPLASQVSESASDPALLSGEDKL